MGVANVSRESELRNVVANVGREMRSQMESRNEVANGSRENKKIRGVCNWDPEGSN